MQHLEERTIHAWLDGALSPNEALRVREHVEECPQCGLAVAEARGFIAASSRILTALDNTPGGVIPAAAPRKRIDPLVWRLAATVLIVAAGTLVVFRNYAGTESPASIATTTADSLPQQTAAAQRAAPAITPTTTVSPAPQVKTPSGGASQIPPSRRTAPAPTMRVDIGARDNMGVAGKMMAPMGQNAAVPEIAGNAAPGVPTVGVASASAMDSARASASVVEPLKVVATVRSIGTRVTFYEVTPGDTVTLTETMATSLNAMVVPNGAGSAMAQRAATKSAAAPSPNAVATADAPQTTVANPTRTITWMDPTTGSRLTLSGRIPEARLQEIRARIERERAAAKKNP